MSEMTLKYEKLGPSKAEFRVLDIQPGSEDEQLHGTLRIVSFDDNPWYEAVSYVWGDAQITLPIQVDGCSFAATVNLHDFLRVLRRHDETITVWADAICINQDDLDERMQQVGIMGTIYGEASQVHIWFGDFPGDWRQEVISGTEGYPSYLDFFDDYYRICLEQYHHTKHDGDLGGDSSQLRDKLSTEEPLQGAIDVMTLVAGGEDPLRLPFYDIEVKGGRLSRQVRRWASKIHHILPHEDAVEDLRLNFRVKPNKTWYDIVGSLIWLVQRRWWTRCWTLQEAVVPSCDPVIHVGLLTFSFQSMLDFWQRMGKIFASSQDDAVYDVWWCGLTPTAHLDHLRQVSTLRSGFSERREIWFEEALAVALARRATVPHDKLYSIMGLIPDELRFPADYTVSYPELCSITTKLLLIDDNLEIWHFYASGMHSRDCPSWAVDIISAFSNETAEIFGRYSASSNTKATVSRIQENLKDLTLRLDGVCIATVRSQQIGRPGMVNLDDGTKVVDICVDLQAYASMHGLSGTCAQFWRTLLHDKVPGSLSRLQAQSLEDFTSWWELHSKDCDIKGWQGAGNLRVCWQAKKSRDPTNTLPRRQKQRQVMPLLEVMDFLSSMAVTMRVYNMFFTERGEPGVGKPGLEPGDEIFIIRGVNVPIVARRYNGESADTGPRYQYVSECYLDGWMDGDTINDETPWKEIVFV